MTPMRLSYVSGRIMNHAGSNHVFMCGSTGAPTVSDHLSDGVH
jgi:hypothetical protein